ncbi:hypothetical protein [Mycolicibacterium hodleri]|uniref:hypothetical protein n=1 Tax=Mycolicibacterium hodleri TaxID=49897 RepID=UPI0018787C00|nr:hypothetical protein [Mycolicibacterium hodleri]
MTVYDLYGVPPDRFLARRKELVAAAKRRGDVDAAKSVGAARRPTAAAWVVNLLVRRDETASARLSDLGENLRAAHAAMDGPRIRELTGVQRKLIDGLVRAGLTAAGYVDPSAALRNDVTDTLQAAVADPDVLARLGRLEKAERWSGFGEFGSVTAVGPISKSKSKPMKESTKKTEPPQADLDAARGRVDAARADAAVAQEAAAAATEALSERTATFAAARRRYEKLLASLDAAEQAMNAAEEQLAAAGQNSQEAADRLDAAMSVAAVAEAELARLDPPADMSR